jgi:hypothetical protein
MTDGGGFPEGLPQGADQPAARSSGGAIDRLAYNPNALELNVNKLSTLAAGIRTNGLTRDQLLQIYNGKFIQESGLHSQVIGNQSDRIKSQGGDVRSFTRGVTLAYHLIDEASVNGTPILSPGSLQLMSEYSNRPETLEALREACDRLLGTQHPLSRAFDEALEGMPEGTDRDMARFGGGYFLLGELAAAQFGGTGTEAWFEPDQK